MVSTADQATRELAVFVGHDKLALRKLAGSEELSRLFKYDLEMLSGDQAIDPTEIIGGNVTFLMSEDGEVVRYFNGFVRSFGQNDYTGRATTYHATVVPWLWFLTQTTDCRIFQDQTTPEIIEQIFEDLGFDWYELQLRSSYEAREYCVQYRETDFDFVSRLLEEEGIFYYFRHENGKHTLVLADHPTSYFELPDSSVEFLDAEREGVLVDQITTWRHEKRYSSGRWSHTDYNFKTPSNRLMTETDSLVGLKDNKVFEVYDYPGRYDEKGVGKAWVDRRIEAEETPHDTVLGRGGYRTFTPGGTFAVAGHKNVAEVGRSYVLVAVETKASVNGTYLTGTGLTEIEEVRFENKFRCIPDYVPFRPRRSTPRALVEGPQTAFVVGPAGEEIYTDEFGRVKVQFHWDREGSRDEHSSCWIRVSQAHAGKGWGSIDLPRIGEEVIVSFLEGNPDRPIIKGRVYNAEAMPPFALPAEMTRSGGKSDTHQGSGNNEVSADDTAGAEQLRTNAQYNMDAAVGNNQTLAVGVDKTEDIGNNDDLTVAVDSSTEVGNDAGITVGNNTTYEVANNIVIEAGTSITLACGASTIHMNQAGVITISGQFVTSAARATNSTVAPITTISGTSMLNQAGAVALMLGGIAKVSGTTSAEVASAGATAVNGGTVVVKGGPIKIGEAGAPIVSIPAPGAGGGGSASGGPPGGLSETKAQDLADRAYDTKDMQALKDAKKPYKAPDGTEWEVLDVHEDSDGYKAVVFRDPNTNQVVVAFGGTDSLDDWDDNLLQGAGGIPPQYRKADELVGRLHDKYGDDLVVTGHSLGGGLANYSAGMHGVPGVGFNAAPLGLGTQAAIALHAPPGSTDNFVHYNNQRDIVSKLPGQQLGTIVTHINDKGYWVSHSHGISTINPSDPIIAQGPLANQVYQDHWRNQLSAPSVGEPTETSQ